MVFAKTAPVAAKLSQAIAGGTLQKEYLAVLGARPKDDSGELFDLLFHDRFKNKTYVVSKERKGVKKASLSYRVVAEADGLCLVHVRLHTGRTHQIRVQFASRGMPLVGDGKYGSRKCSFARSVVLRADASDGRRDCTHPRAAGSSRCLGAV